MTKIFLDVPFVSQLEYGDPASPMNDWTGCWYASACMVAKSFEARGRGFRRSTTRGWPFGHVVGRISDPDGERAPGDGAAAGRPDLDGEDLGALLRKYGPLSFGWIKDAPDGGEYGHRSVLIGYDSDGDVLTFHDPELAPNSTMTVEVFNSRFNGAIPAGRSARREGTGLFTRSG